MGFTFSVIPFLFWLKTGLIDICAGWWVEDMWECGAGWKLISIEFFGRAGEREAERCYNILQPLPPDCTFSTWWLIIRKNIFKKIYCLCDIFIGIAYGHVQ